MGAKALGLNNDFIFNAPNPEVINDGRVAFQTKSAM